MTERIVLAVDGGSASDSALEWVLDRARSTDVQLEIATVFDIDWIPYGGADPYMLEYEQMVLEYGRRVAASGVAVQCSTTVHHDRTLPGLLALSRHADLLVVGSHKPSRARGFVNGTLPLAIAARTHAALVVVPVGWTPSDGPIVVGIDDETGQSALAFAASEAEHAHVDLVAVRAWEAPVLVTGTWITLESAADDFRRSHQSVIDGMLVPLRDEHPRLGVREVLEHGRPSLIVAEQAKGARLTVVGTHHHRALAGFLLGSVGHDLLMNLPSPVAIVPSPTRAGAEASADAEMESELEATPS